MVGVAETSGSMIVDGVPPIVDGGMIASLGVRSAVEAARILRCSSDNEAMAGSASTGMSLGSKGSFKMEESSSLSGWSFLESLQSMVSPLAIRGMEEMPEGGGGGGGEGLSREDPLRCK